MMEDVSQDPHVSGYELIIFIVHLALIGLGFFDIFRFGGCCPPIIFVVCEPIATKFCKGIDNQSISSNIEKNCINLMTSL